MLRQPLLRVVIGCTGLNQMASRSSFQPSAPRFCFFLILQSLCTSGTEGSTETLREELFQTRKYCVLQHLIDNCTFSYYQEPMKMHFINWINYKHLHQHLSLDKKFKSLNQADLPYTELVSQCNENYDQKQPENQILLIRQ